jgi:cation transport ATPase
MQPIHHRIPDLRFLFIITIVNYLAQIPYYLHNYYFPHHLSPTDSSIILLGITLIWFLLGYIGLQAHKVIGYWILLSFLAIEAVFYLHTLLYGAVFAQLRNQSPLIKTVFIVGYLSGIVSAYYVTALLRFKDRYLDTSRPQHS